MDDGNENQRIILHHITQIIHVIMYDGSINQSPLFLSNISAPPPSRLVPVMDCLPKRPSNVNN
jgi:hypothetical protein